MSFAGTATRDTHYLRVSDHQSKTFLNLRNLMTSLEAVEIERAKLHAIKCPKCKADLMIKPTEKVCPIRGDALPVQKKQPSYNNPRPR
jgi:uncharacterized Zn finger protein (UPF0148 family)